jgi:hypothetical protein
VQQRHTRGRAGERKAAGMPSGSGTGGRARAAWQHAGGTARAGECHDLVGSVLLGRQRNSRVHASMGTGWRLARGGRMPDMWRSHVDGEEVAWPKKRIAAREMNCSSTASKHSREPATELGCAGREEV